MLCHTRPRIISASESASRVSDWFDGDCGEFLFALLRLYLDTWEFLIDPFATRHSAARCRSGI